MSPVFWQRRYPSANVILLPGARPVLVDTGFGASVPALFDWLIRQGVNLAMLRVVNTHAHTDHVGGNHALALRGIPSAMAAVDAAPILARDVNACAADFLAQPIEPFTVAHILHPGEVIDTGVARWTVVPTPGHTAGHISLTDGTTIVLGDALHGTDLGWIDLHTYPEGLDWTADTLARLARLPARVGYSGHGPAITDLPAALARGESRLARFRADPAQAVWHGARRNFAHHLVMTGGVNADGMMDHFGLMPWLGAMAALLSLSPAAFLDALVTSCVRGDAAHWQEGRLLATVAHDVPPPGWAQAPTSPADWSDVPSPAWR